ncbi:MAG: flavodoxin family protein [Methyloceanibacter sp.]|nr:flavodoxin family protein [Methyloceanibacter sp.]
MRALVVTGSPRRNGNSALLAKSAAEGLSDAGHTCEIVDVSDVMNGFLRDCRTCRKDNGECAIGDGFRRAFLDSFLPADGIIFATPVYWYGMSAQLKAFFDRMFCYVAASYPGAERVVRDLTGKRIGLISTSEETYPTVAAGIVHQLHEYCRYTESTFVGAVHGIGNARGEVENDPSQPLLRARSLGQHLFERHAADYTIDAPRPGRVWA